MIPSSPRLVAFAQSECDLTTPSVSRLPPVSFYRYSLRQGRVSSAFRSFSWWVGPTRVNVFVGGWLRPEASNF